MCGRFLVFFLGLNGVHSHSQTYSWSSLSSLCHPSPAWVPSVSLVFCPSLWKDISYWAVTSLLALCRVLTSERYCVADGGIDSGTFLSLQLPWTAAME